MQWEYKVIELKPDSSLTGGNFGVSAMNETLNDLGREGWEIAVGLDTNMVYGASRSLIIVLKRPRDRRD